MSAHAANSHFVWSGYFYRSVPGATERDDIAPWRFPLLDKQDVLDTARAALRRLASRKRRKK